MLPQFNNQNTPVTPNNGNPNTIYNKPRATEYSGYITPVGYLPGEEALDPVYEPTASVQPTFAPMDKNPRSAGPVVPETMLPNYGMLQPQQEVKPVRGSDDNYRGPMHSDAVPMPKPRPISVGDSGPVAPVISGPSIPGSPSTATPVVTPESVSAPDNRTTMGQWLPRFAIDPSVLGTQFGSSGNSSLDYWRQRLGQIRSGGTQPQDPGTTPGPGTGGGATGPIAQPNQPADPITPVIRPPNDSATPGIIGVDPQFNTGQFGLGAGLGLANFSTVASAIFPNDPSRSRQAADTLARTYPLMDAAQRAEVEELDNPSTPPERRRSILQRVGDFLKREWEKEKANWSENPMRELINTFVPGVGTAIQAGVDIFRPDVDPMIREGMVTVGRTTQTNTGDRSAERASPR